MFYLIAQEFGIDVDIVKHWPLPKSFAHASFLEKQHDMLEAEMPKIPKISKTPQGALGLKHSGRKTHATQFR